MLRYISEYHVWSCVDISRPVLLLEAWRILVEIGGDSRLQLLFPAPVIPSVWQTYSADTSLININNITIPFPYTVIPGNIGHWQRFQWFGYLVGIDSVLICTDSISIPGGSVCSRCFRFRLSPAQPKEFQAVDLSQRIATHKILAIYWFASTSIQMNSNQSIRSSTCNLDVPKTKIQDAPASLTLTHPDPIATELIPYPLCTQKARLTCHAVMFQGSKPPVVNAEPGKLSS